MNQCFYLFIWYFLCILFLKLYQRGDGDMKFLQMEYFLAVAKELNFTAAAKSLYISQPALSKQIALLEEELGTKLFLRNSRKVALTADGKQFQKDLTEIYHQLEHAKANVTRIGKTEKLHFSIGCFDGADIQDFLPDAFSYLKKLDPNIQISLYRGNFLENRNALERDDIDLLFTLDLELAPDSSYQMQKIIRRKGALIYSDLSPAAEKTCPTVMDFAQEPALVLKHQLSPGITQSTILNLQKLGITNPKLQELENFATLFANLELGHGFAILTEGASDHYPHLNKIVLGEEFGTWVVAVWKKGNPIAELLMDCYPGNL